ncbi:MAG: hypothetical protein JWN18_287 [Parcubacteria group bacterium]|nr:hypothetical protein [Parcubacteria group bacterium]
MVVLAIIGVLSAVVLGLLSKPRSSGADAAIKGDLRTIQTQSQLFYGDNSDRYSTNGTGFPAASCPTSGVTMFAADTAIKNAIAHINSVSGTTATCYMNATASQYLVWIQLKTSGYWCVDHTGVSKSESVAYAAQTSC